MSKTWDSRYNLPNGAPRPVPHTNSYYASCMIAGALACGPTHTGVVALDVSKCNMQANPKTYTSLPQAASKIFREEGFRGITKGWAPTAIGYSMQGVFKFGLNEVFKDYYSNLVGKENAKKYRVLLWACASGSAEFFADIALCPMEMVKVKVQTSKPGSFPIGLGPAIGKMMEMRAETKFPFGSLGPLWGRQIPYTIMKFVGFEAVVEAFYRYIFTAERKSYSKGTQLGITFASGYIAGILCAIISQPFDNLVSQMGNPENKGKTFGMMAREQGMAKLFMKGLGTRIIMIGTLTGFQWWIYDVYKQVSGLGGTGGEYAAKK